jgi:hypothetical protein
VERHSAFGYWIEENVSFNFNEGTVAFWVKPAFFPEMTGKSRTLLSLSRYHAHAPETLNLSPFALFFVPGPARGGPLWPVYGSGLFRPASLAFGFGFSADTGYNWEMAGPGEDAASHAFAFTPTLNHEGAGPDDGDPRSGDGGRFNPLRAHEWTHLAVTWDNPRGELPGPDTVQIHVNGRILPGSAGMPHLYAPEHGRGQPFLKTPRWAIHSLQALLPGADAPKWCVNSIRLGGEPSTLFDGVLGDVFPRNFSADATFDEFYVWRDRRTSGGGGLAGVQILWGRGRYYKPDDADAGDALFTSAPVTLPVPSRRALPPPAPIADPSGRGPEGTPPAPPPPRWRLLGIAWTELAEDYDRQGPAMSPVLFDYSAESPRALHPAGGTVADLWVRAGGAAFGPFHDPGYSVVKTPAGTPPEVGEGEEVRWAAKLKMGGPASPGAVLLSTPVLDDVTIYFDRGGPEILGWISSGGGP